MKNISFNKIPFEGDQRLRLSISCSATFDQLFRFGATFSPSSNFSDFVQLFSFLNNFLAFLRQFVTKNRPFKF